jgi:hypothetical protein
MEGDFMKQSKSGKHLFPLIESGANWALLPKTLSAFCNSMHCMKSALILP